MLSPFQIRNLRPSQPSATAQDSLVRISAPGYDKAISSHPAGKLKYQDEDDGETITVGSSTELAQRLDEPVSRKTRYRQHSSRNPMAIATLLSESQQSPPSLMNHVFDIEDREEIRRLWQDIQERNSNVLRPTSPICAIKAMPTWTQSEDELLLKLRGSGMGWGDIQRQLPGRTAFSCRYRYETGLDSKNTWNEDKKDEFARAYGRLRASIWGPIARELSLSWREAEAMHWDIGEARLASTALTALSNPHTEKHVSGNASSGESPTNSEVTSKPSSQPVLHLRNHNPDQDMAAYRAHYFESTRPPKLQSEQPAKQKDSDSCTSQAQPCDPVRSSSVGALSSSLDTSPTENLTQEGRRQAQAAGDKLRARRTPSRHRRMAMAVNDHISYQNRWASYKSQGSTFLPQESINTPEGFDGHILTAEGRRQAQVAGDKLRCRTNPIRHSRPSRGSVSDHGISKNRWSSYGTRAIRLDEKQDMKPESKEKAPSGEAMEQEPREQPSLLEVFEAELAKKISMDTFEEDARTHVPEAAAATMPVKENTPQLSDSSSVTAPAQSGPSPKEFKPLLDGLKTISDHLEGLGVRDEDMYHEFPRAIGQGFRAAMGGLTTFMRGVTSGLQEASNLTRQAAERTREADLRIIDDTILGLRGVAGDVTALGQEIFPERPEASQPKEEVLVAPMAGSESSTAAKLSGKVIRPSLDSQAILSEAKVVTEQFRAPSTKGSPRSIPATKATVGPKAITIGQGHNPRFVSDIPVTVTRISPPDSRRMSRNLGMNKVPRYHKPGPIHLPHHAPLAQSASSIEVQSVAPRTDYADHLQRYPSPEYAAEADMNQSTTLPAAAARFPSLAQFEGQHLNPKVQFPPLPSIDMKPLVPLRANSRSESGKPNEDLQLLFEEQTKTEAEASADPSMTHRGLVSPGLRGKCMRGSPGPDLTHTPPMQLQNAPSSMNHASAYNQLHLMLQEHNKGQRVLMAREEQEQIAPDRAKTTITSTVEQQALSSNAQTPVPYFSDASEAKISRNHAILDRQMQSTRQRLLEKQGSAPVINIMNGGFIPPPSFRYRRNSSGLLVQVPVFGLEEHEALSVSNPSAGSAGNSNVQDHQNLSKDMITEQENKTQSLDEKVERSDMPDDVQIPGAFPNGDNIKRNDMLGQQEEDAGNSLATHPAPWYEPLPSAMNKKESSDRLSSAARLAEPFDPLGAEPSARRHLTEGIRRNATVAGTDSRHNSRRRRPYSEAFDGNGRVGWDTFLHQPSAPQTISRPSSFRPLSRGSWINDNGPVSKPQSRGSLSRASFEDFDNDRYWTSPAHHKSNQTSGSASGYYGHEQSRAIDPCEVDREISSNVGERKRSPPARVTAPRPGPTFNSHEERKNRDNCPPGKSYAHILPSRESGISFQDRDERNKIYDCVSRLRDLGFDHADDNDGPEGRLLQYASAAGGDLVAAIDMIDEEQRAYKERENDALRFIDSI
ncbi:hypothetical protein N7G274_007811 [Stereocaulon virgatum]|uniref:Myb-like domain-containing protein n=1 Tax=Stereocaulon virgatum TaxID=373712 RepID=A0ABR4A0Q9_9LECA